MKKCGCIKIALAACFIAQTLNAQIISKAVYTEKLHGFWLGSCIANWTGLQTEGRRTSKPYYTDDNWSSFGYILNQDPWGSDDDTDIEYIFWHAMETYLTSKLSGEQIRDQWLEHISATEENYLWASNESAFDLMRNQGFVPPATSEPANNPNWEMIDAQLVTESFGFMAPANPKVALDISYLPIRTMAYSHSMYASQFYVVMYSLASSVDTNLALKDQLMWMADSARTFIPDSSYIAKMYDWVKAQYLATTDKNDWEKVRDAFHDRYVAVSTDGYTYNSWVESGVNFGFSIISLLFGEGDLKKTIKVGALCGMDSDNPTATWGGLLGFMYGTNKIQKHFQKFDFSDKYNIARTRIGFGDGSSSDQYDTYVNGTPSATQYVGYTFTATKTFSKVIFQEGLHLDDGGWFANGSLKVQVRNGSTWSDVSANVTPAYPNGNDTATFNPGFQIYTFTLNSVQGDGLRIIGTAGGGAQYISVTELQVFENNSNITSQGTIIATVTAPNGSGNKNIEIIRDGKMPQGSGIDSFTAMVERGLSIVDSVVKVQMGGTVTADAWYLSEKTAARGTLTPIKANSSFSVQLKGKALTIYFNDAFAYSDQTVKVFDLKGKLLSETLIRSGSLSNKTQCMVPSKGIYLVQCGNMVSSVTVK